MRLNIYIKWCHEIPTESNLYVWVYLNVKYHNMKYQIVFNLNRMYHQNGRMQDIDV